MINADDVLSAGREAAFKHANKLAEAYRGATEGYVARKVKEEMDLRERMQLDGFFAGWLAGAEWFSSQVGIKSEEKV